MFALEPCGRGFIPYFDLSLCRSLLLSLFFWVVLLYLYGQGRGLLVLIKSSSKGEVTHQTKVVAECSFSFHLLGGPFFFSSRPFKPKPVKIGHQSLTSPAWHVRYQSLSRFGSLSFDSIFGDNYLVNLLFQCTLSKFI